MFLTKLKIAAALLFVIGVLSTGTAGLTYQFMASGPLDEPRPAQTKASEAGRSLFGTVKEWDAERQTITLTVISGDGKLIDLTRPLAKDLKVTRLEGTEGRLADVIVNTQVELQLDSDTKAVLEIRSKGTPDDKVRWLEGQLSQLRIERNELENKVQRLESVAEEAKRVLSFEETIKRNRQEEQPSRIEIEQRLKKLEEKLKLAEREGAFPMLIGKFTIAQYLEFERQFWAEVKKRVERLEQEFKSTKK